MSDVNLKLGGPVGLPFGTGVQYGVAERIIDCAKDNIGSGYYAQLIDVPADSLFLFATIEVQTAEGSAVTCDIGFRTIGGVEEDYDAVFNDFSLNAVAKGCSWASGSAYQYGRYHSAAHELVLIPSAALDKVKFVVRAYFVNTGLDT